jgi:hypothetical protein
MNVGSSRNIHDLLNPVNPPKSPFKPRVHTAHKNSDYFYPPIVPMEQKIISNIIVFNSRHKCRGYSKHSQFIIEHSRSHHPINPINQKNPGSDNHKLLYKSIYCFTLLSQLRSSSIICFLIDCIFSSSLYNSTARQIACVISPTIALLNLIPYPPSSP